MIGGNMCHDAFARTLEILDGLVAFKNLSGQSNLDLIAYVTDLLESHGIGHALSTDETGLQADLIATIGPERDGGIILPCLSTRKPVLSVRRFWQIRSTLCQIARRPDPCVPVVLG